MAEFHLNISVHEDSNVVDMHSEINLIRPPPVLKFEMHMDRNPNLVESILPARVFRKHLQIAKNEETFLHMLRNNFHTSLHKNSLMIMDGLDNVESKPKMNCFQKAIYKSKEVAKKLAELSNLASGISFEDVILHPMLSYPGKVLLCRNATLPVLSNVASDSYVLNTVVEDIIDSSKVARLEVICDLHEANLLAECLKNPYLHGMEPNSTVLLKNPIFKYDSSGESLSICVNTTKDLVFLGHEIPPVLKTDRTEKEVKTEESSSESEASMSTTTLTTLNNEDNSTEEGDRIGWNSEASFWIPSSTCEENRARDEWKEWGNVNSVLRKHSQALNAYTIAQRFDPQCIELTAAKSASLINLGLFYTALKELDSVITKEPFNTGLILRKTHCFWGLGKYDTAIDFLKATFEMLVSTRKQNTEEEFARKSLFIQNVISKTEKMIRQSTSPELMDYSYLFCKNQTQMFYNEPDYYGPIRMIFKTKFIDGSNRKEKTIVTNQAVPAGTLLAKVKAFSNTFQDKRTETRPDSFIDELLNLTIQKVVSEQQTHVEFDNFEENDTASQQKFQEVSNAAIIKFCEKHLYEGSHNLSTELPMAPPMVDEQASIYCSSVPFQSTVRGLWIFPANIRHVCVGGNAIWNICGNIMFIRAISDIKDGEEVLMAHVGPTKSLEFRQQFLRTKEIDCSCTLCQFEIMESGKIKAKRVELFKDPLLKILNSSACTPEFSSYEARRLKHCLDDLENLRSAYAKLNFPTVEPLYKFGISLMKMENFDAAINAFEKAFYVVDNTAAIFTLVHLSFLLSYCYMAKKKNADKSRSKKWFAAASSYAKLSYGCLIPIKYKFKQEFEYLKRKGVIL